MILLQLSLVNLKDSIYLFQIKLVFDLESRAFICLLACLLFFLIYLYWRTCLCTKFYLLSEWSFMNAHMCSVDRNCQAVLLSLLSPCSQLDDDFAIWLWKLKCSKGCYMWVLPVSQAKEGDLGCRERTIYSHSLLLSISLQPISKNPLCSPHFKYSSPYTLFFVFL